MISDISTRVADQLQVVVTRRVNRDLMVRAEFVLDAGVTVMFGPSGAGKTTIVRMLAGLVTPDDGTIRVGDRVLYESRNRIDVAPQQRRAGYVSQTPALFPHLSALQNVEFGLATLDADARRQRALALLESFGLREAATRKPAELSGGEQQRVALARALAPAPSYLLLDEPLSGLDRATKALILDRLNDWLASHPIPVLYVTHDRDELFSAATRVLVMDGGTIVSSGAPQATLKARRHLAVAAASEFENLIAVHIVSVNERHGTMRCRAQGVEIECPMPEGERRSQATIGIAADDILLASEHPHGLSARNCLQGSVASLRARDHGVAVEVAIGELRLVSQVTHAAVETLGLAAGAPVWVVFKTHSCHVTRD